MNSMLHDAADGKLVPTTHLYSLAKAYESLIDKRDARIRELEKEKEGDAQQQQRPAEPPPPRGADGFVCFPIFFDAQGGTESERELGASGALGRWCAVAADAAGGKRPAKKAKK